MNSRIWGPILAVSFFAIVGVLGILLYGERGLVAASSAALGFATGLLVGVITEEVESKDLAKLLPSIAGILGGGGVLVALSYVTGTRSEDYLFFPFGFLVGVLVAPFYNALLHRIYTEYEWTKWFPDETGNDD
jgi:hypothetical protein